MFISISTRYKSRRYSVHNLLLLFISKESKMSVQRCINGLSSKFTVVLGAQWGDEGKGKLVDILSPKYDICARFNGGANAGHTVVKKGVKYALHLLPCGLLTDRAVNVIGNGTVVHLPTLFRELDQLTANKINYSNRLFLSDRAHLVTAYQIAEDERLERTQNLGTTKRGIGPTYSAKINRFGLRVGDLLDWKIFQEKYARMASFYPGSTAQNDLEKIRPLRDKLVSSNMIIDSVFWLNQQIAQGKSVMAEGANAGLLDIDLGTYPYVTSSATAIGGVCTGLGVPPHSIKTVIGVAKAYSTRVGEGPFPTELHDSVGEAIRAKGREFGTTTGRPRRCGWLDIPILRYTHMINGYSSFNVTKLDILDELNEIKVAVGYRINGKVVDVFPSSLDALKNAEVIYETLPGWKSDTSKVRNRESLPKNAEAYLRMIEKYTEVKVSWVGTGPGDDAMFLF